MTKTELIRIIALRQNISLDDAKLAVNGILRAIVKTISEQGRVEIRGFGVFGVTHRDSRKGRNPANGSPVDVRGKYVPRFKPGKDLAERVNESIGSDSTTKKSPEVARGNAGSARTGAT